VRDRALVRIQDDPNDPEELARTLDAMLADPVQRFAWGHPGQRRVHDEFLVFAQVRQWMRVLAVCAGAGPHRPVA
jgi:trehalose synthase